MKTPLAAVVTLALLSSCSAQHTVLLQRRCGGTIRMPVMEIRPPHEAGRALLILISGDGGWRAIDKGVAGEFTSRGVPTVGLLSHLYFANGRSIDGVACDIGSLIEHYAAAWDKDRIVLVGYSRGADAVPFVLKRLPANLRSKIVLAAMLAPAEQAELLYKPFWNPSPVPAAFRHPIAPELAAGSTVKLLCIHGTKEESSLCPKLAPGTAIDIPIAGGHHFDHDYEALGKRIYAAAGL